MGYNVSMDIRTLTTEDLDAALELWARTEQLGTVTRAEVEGLLAHDAELVLAAVDGDVLVGVVLGSYDGRRGWINRLAVDGGVRRQGVGRALIAELEHRLAARGCVRVNLLVFSGNDAGRGLWETLGYGTTEDVVLYGRALSDDHARSSAC